MTDTIAVRVARGAALLDAKRPGWEHEIDLRRLDLGSWCDCVVGQLFGDYSDGLGALGIHYWGISHGFSSGSGMYAGLTRAWKRLIRERLVSSGGNGPRVEGE